MPDFFEQPILNSPYEYSSRHWETDAHGQPTNRLVERRRIAAFITPIPKPKKQRRAERSKDLDYEREHSTAEQKYEPIPIINAVRAEVDRWRAIAEPARWQVTPETAWLLQQLVTNLL